MQQWSAWEKLACFCNVVGFHWPTAYAGVIQLTECHTAPSAALYCCQLLNYWKNTKQKKGRKKKNLWANRQKPRVSSISDYREYSIVVCAFSVGLKKLDWLNRPNCFKCILSALNLFTRVILVSAVAVGDHGRNNKHEHWAAGLVLTCYYLLLNASSIPSGNCSFRISQRFLETGNQKLQQLME